MSQKKPRTRHQPTFYSKRSCDQCTCGAVTSHMSPDYLTSENKRRTSDVVCPKRVNTKLPKTATKPKAETTRITGWSAWCHTLPRVFGCVPATRAYNHFIYLHYITTAVLLQIYKFTEVSTRRPSHPASSEFLHLQLPCMHLNCSLSQWPQLLQGWPYRGVATSCGIGVQPRVIKSERFLLIHDRPPFPQSSSSLRFGLLLHLTLLELCPGWTTVQGSLPPVPPLLQVPLPPPAHLPLPPPPRSHRAISWGGRSRALQCGPPLGKCMAHNSPMPRLTSLPPNWDR